MTSVLPLVRDEQDPDGGACIWDCVYTRLYRDRTA